MTAEVSLLSWASLIRGKPFIWGETDCVMLTLLALDKFLGTKNASTYAGRWTSREDALSYFDKETPSQWFTEHKGSRVDPAYAVIGDTITLPADPWPEQCHFILGHFSLAADEARGVILIPTRFLLRQPGATVWRLAQCLKQSQ